MIALPFMLASTLISALAPPLANLLVPNRSNAVGPSKQAGAGASWTPQPGRSDLVGIGLSPEAGLAVAGVVVTVLLFAYFETAWIRLFHAERSGDPITAGEALRGAADRIRQLLLTQTVLIIIGGGTIAAMVLLTIEQPIVAAVAVPLVVLLAVGAAPYVATTVAAVALAPNSRFVLPAARQAVHGRWEFAIRAVFVSFLPSVVLTTAAAPLDGLEIRFVSAFLDTVLVAGSAALQAAGLAAVYYALHGYAADVPPES